MKFYHLKNTTMGKIILVNHKEPNEDVFTGDIVYHGDYSIAGLSFRGIARLEWFSAITHETYQVVADLHHAKNEWSVYGFNVYKQDSPVGIYFDGINDLRPVMARIANTHWGKEVIRYIFSEMKERMSEQLEMINKITEGIK